MKSEGRSLLESTDKLGPPWLAPHLSLQRFGGERREAEVGPIAVHFFDVELAHELDDLRAHDLTRYENRKSRRIGDHEPRGDERTPRLERSLCFGERHVFRRPLREREKERRADVPIADDRCSEGGVKTAEVGQRRK